MRPWLKLFANARGSSIVENLVAMSILSTAVAATVPAVAGTYRATHNVRNQAAVLEEVEQMFADYRAQPLTTLLGNIDDDVTNIDDGDAGEVEVESASGKASYLVTFTAVKTGTIGAPEAVRIKIEITQNRGGHAAAEYSFETLVTQVI